MLEIFPENGKPISLVVDIVVMGQPQKGKTCDSSSDNVRAQEIISTISEAVLYVGLGNWTIDA